MSEGKDPEVTNRCTDERLGKLLHQYELGMLGEEDRTAFEMHLYECDTCFAEVQDLWEESRLLRHDPEARLIAAAASKRAAGDQDSAVQKREPMLWRRWKTMLPTSIAAAAVLVLLILRPWQINIRTADDVAAAEYRLVVMAFENVQDPDDQSRLGEVVANLLITDLSESKFVEVISPERVSDIRKLILQSDVTSDSSDLAAMIAEHAGARWILRGDVIRDQQVTAITSRLVEYPGLEVIATQKVIGRVDEPIFSLVDRLTIRIKSDLSLPAEALAEIDPPVADITTHFPEAYLRFLEGVDFVQKMYLPEAIEAFESCLAIDSSYAMAYYYLAELKDSDLIDRAVEHIDRASHKDKYYIRSRAASYIGDGVGSRAELEELLVRYPDEKEALFQLGLYAHQERDYEEAVGRMTDVLRIDPLHKPALNQLSYTYDAAGNFEMAVNAINNLIRLTPNEPNPYDSRGDLLARNGLLEEAVESYRIALAKKPDFRPSRQNLGHMYVFQGKYAEARQQYLGLIEEADLPYIAQNRLNLAFVSARRGMFDVALDALDTAIISCQDAAERNLTRQRALPHFLKFWIHLEMNQISRAVEEADSCIYWAELAHHSRTVGYRWIQAYALAKAGEYHRADSVIEGVAEFCRQNSLEPTAYYWTAGMVALARHDGPTAVSMMEKAVEGHTPATNFMGFARLGHAYVEDGRYEEAVTTLESTVKVLVYDRLLDGVYGVKVHYHLGLAYEGLGEYASATDQYTKFLEIWKDADSNLAAVAGAKERLTRLETTP
ncbi:MAG: tetratricopeptide repeat protein [Candidatus Zixiibacteriota bacterium]|nr:MAG: tetratricopeptide repeat protein [candidate division Zixibacteria bacterium]